MAMVQHTKQTIKQQSNLQEVVSVGGRKRILDFLEEGTEEVRSLWWLLTCFFDLSGSYSNIQFQICIDKNQLVKASNKCK